MPGISTNYLQRGLTLRHLHLLVQLDETRHVGRVATALHVSQPAISKALADIEAGIGVPLFERTPRGLLPTEHGTRLVRFAYSVFNDIARLGDELASVDQQPAAVVVAVGVMPSVGSNLLPAAIARSRERLPELVATVTEGPTFALLRQLQAGKLDVVVGAVTDALPGDIVQQPLYADAVVAVCGRTNSLADGKRPSWESLLAQPWVLPPHPAGARKAIEGLWGRLGHRSPRVLAELVSPEMTVELLDLEPSIGVLPKRLARRYAAAGRLAVLDIELTGMVIPMAVFTLARVTPSERIEAFVQGLVETAAPG
jgi:DNA-binding transcriptional LysR family regulator